MPLLVNIGHVRTPAVEMKVKFAGFESLLFEDIEKFNVPVAVVSPAKHELLHASSMKKEDKDIELVDQIEKMDVDDNQEDIISDNYLKIKDYM